MIKYYIISPDGFSTQPEPFQCKEEEFETDVRKNFKEWKSRFETQGYYSSNSGRISLNELSENCSVTKVGE